MTTEKSTINFEKYWKNLGKFEQQVIKNPRELEEDFYNLAKKIWDISYSSANSDYESGYEDGYQTAEKDCRCDCCD